MRKVLLFLGVLLIAACIIVFPVSAQGAELKIPVDLDGLPVAFDDVQPALLDSRVLVPFRSIAEALNVQVHWDGDNQKIFAAGAKTQVELQIGNSWAYRNGSEIILDVPPVIINGRTLIPLRFFSEAFGCTVNWLGFELGVKIVSPRMEMASIGFYALGDSRTSSWTNLFGRPYPEVGEDNTDAVSELALGWYSIDAQGSLLTRSLTGWQRPAGWEEVLKAAGEYNLKTEMVIHVTNKDRLITSFLGDGTAVKRLIAGIMEEVKVYDGVNLNFEGLGLSEKGDDLRAVQDMFTGFVKLLAAELQPAGKSLTLTIHAPNSAYKGYDYKSLGESADRIVIMAYDYGPKPEPVNMVLQAVEMARAAVPAEKLILGISAPYENSESILTKVGIAKRYGLGGIAIWRLGLVPADMWDALRSTITAVSAH
ncbi:MAG: stalk domain-containing protein [Bacillota bacterium]